MTSRQDIEETQALLKELRETDMAEEAFCEVRLSKGTQELKEELTDMIDKMNADDAKASSTGLQFIDFVLFAWRAMQEGQKKKDA